MLARTARRAQAARLAPMPRAHVGRLLVVVDPTVGLDETPDAPLVDLVDRVEPGPRRQRDPVTSCPGYGARMTCRSYRSTIALSFATRSGHSQLYCTTTPPSSRLCTWSSRTIGRVWTPHGAMYGRCGPEVGRIRVVLHVRRIGARDVKIALVRELDPRQVRLRSVGEVSQRPSPPARRPRRRSAVRRCFVVRRAGRAR